MTAEKFSSRWQRIEDVSLEDLRAVLFAFNDEECEFEAIKEFEKEDLLLIFEYSTGLDRSHTLSHRDRVGLIAYFVEIC